MPAIIVCMTYNTNATQTAMFFAIASPPYRSVPPFASDDCGQYFGTESPCGIINSQSIQNDACVSHPMASVAEKMSRTRVDHGQRKTKKRNSAITWMTEIAGMVMR